jgi:GAF domain-containing protein
MTISDGRTARDLADIVLEEEPLDAVLEVVCYNARDAIPHAEQVTVTVRDRRGFRTAAHTDERVKKADELQHELEEGPCVDASKENQTFEIEVMRLEERWPRYTPGAVEAGIGSSISLPLYGGGGTSGALNVYSPDEKAFDDEDRRVGAEFARRASVLLANVAAFAEKSELTEQLQDAIATREVIGKAIGILMEREGITDDAAFAMLRTASQNNNVKLRDIAEELFRRTQARVERGG